MPSRLLQKMTNLKVSCTYLNNLSPPFKESFDFDFQQGKFRGCSPYNSYEKVGRSYKFGTLFAHWQSTVCQI